MCRGVYEAGPTIPEMPFPRARLSPCELLVEVLHDDSRPSQAAVEREPRRTNQKTFWDDTGVHARGHPPSRLLNHLLLFRLEADHLRQALAAERRIRLEAHRVHRQGV